MVSAGGRCSRTENERATANGRSVTIELSNHGFRVHAGTPALAGTTPRPRPGRSLGATRHLLRDEALKYLYRLYSGSRHYGRVGLGLVPASSTQRCKTGRARDSGRRGPNAIECAKFRSVPSARGFSLAISSDGTGVSWRCNFPRAELREWLHRLKMRFHLFGGATRSCVFFPASQSGWSGWC